MNNRISKDTYWFINSQNNGIRPIAHYSKINEANEQNKFEISSNLTENFRIENSTNITLD